MRALLIMLILALSGATASAQTPWRVDPAQSSIRFSGTHAGAAFNGRFDVWTADIRFDPANLAASKAIVTIDTASAKTGDAFQERTLRDGEWFDVRRHPQARFETTSIVRVAENRYLANGTLTLKGRATAVAMPFELTINGAAATMRAQLPLDRLTLGLGTASDPNAEWVSRQIPLTIQVRATR